MFFCCMLLLFKVFAFALLQLNHHNAQSSPFGYIKAVSVFVSTHQKPSFTSSSAIYICSLEKESRDTSWFDGQSRAILRGLSGNRVNPERQTPIQPPTPVSYRYLVANANYRKGRRT
ncbi:uncharacterized protein LOC131313667 [Rhododendron vialii]|uniref:uncharacterized protein LOC131313667 n=1 Tax=Rhododendron vialii TaxID=182163 RepID=UPI00265DFEF4|nr:uncharacterized protein LOC131313667 [Rhododendron vialii]